MSMNIFCISMLLYCTLFAHVFRNPCLPLASLSTLLVLSELELEYAPTWIWPIFFDSNEHLARIWYFQYVSSLSPVFLVYFQLISSLFPSIDCALIFLKLMSMNDCPMSNVICYLLLCFQFTFSLCMYTLYISIYMGSQELPSRPLSPLFFYFYFLFDVYFLYLFHGFSTNSSIKIG